MTKQTREEKNRRIYAIGDIHGCANLLEKALAWIATDTKGRPAEIIFIGDYIDRGPESRDVLDILMGGPKSQNDRFICIRGNHEQLCLDAHDSEENMRSWLDTGGYTTLESFNQRIGKKYITWMASLPLIHQDEQRIFVHAGIRPELPLERQRSEDLLWIREPFLLSRKRFSKHIVHGHTPIGPQFLKQRTNLDAGSYQTGKLCVAVFGRSNEASPSAYNLIRS
jgi:serine/threonine protein phosphatase 1